MNVKQQDFLIGFIYGLLSIAYVGWFGLIVAIASGLLWEKGGQEGHAWRVYGCALVVYLAASIHLHSLWIVVPAALSMVILSLGYGLPSTQSPDAGSPLGRFFWKLTKQNVFLSNTLTRGTIYTLLAVTFLSTRLLS